MFVVEFRCKRRWSKLGKSLLDFSGESKRFLAVDVKNVWDSNAHDHHDRVSRNRKIFEENRPLFDARQIFKEDQQRQREQSQQRVAQSDFVVMLKNIYPSVDKLTRCSAFYAQQRFDLTASDNDGRRRNESRYRGCRNELNKESYENFMIKKLLEFNWFNQT